MIDQPGDEAEVSRKWKRSWDMKKMASEEESWECSWLLTRDGLAGGEDIVRGTVPNGKTKGMGMGLPERLLEGHPGHGIDTGSQNQS